MYVPELIFGNLLTGSNFDDDQKKTTGGRNGFGAKVGMKKMRLMLVVFYRAVYNTVVMFSGCTLLLQAFLPCHNLD